MSNRIHLALALVSVVASAHRAVAAEPGNSELHVVATVGGRTADGGVPAPQEQGHVAVTVDRPGKEVTLFVSASQPVLWHVAASNGTILKRVILSGYYEQSVEGLAPEVEVVPFFSDAGTGQYLFMAYSIETADFYTDKQRVCAMTGMDMSSFHGSDRGLYPAPIIIDAVQDDERLRCDYPQPTPLTELPNVSFHAAFYTGGSNGNFFVQNYTLSGPLQGEHLLPAMRVVPDSGGRYYYGVERVAWKVDSLTGTAQKFMPDPILPPVTWPTAMAYDSARDRVLLVTRDVVGYFYGYSPAEDRWSVVHSTERRTVDNLEYHAGDDQLYALRAIHSPGGRGIVYRFTPDGVFLGSIQLPVLPLEIDGQGHRAELISAGDHLVLLIDPYEVFFGSQTTYESRIYLIDPRSGQSWLTYRKIYAPENKSPFAQFVWPGEGMLLPAGQSIPLVVEASDEDGLVDSVEFFANGIRIGAGTRSSDPSRRHFFSLDWINPAPGTYTITAQATDGQGAKSAPTDVRISIHEDQPPNPGSDFELHVIGISSGLTSGSDAMGHASVWVNRPGKRVVLCLTSQSSVLWHVSAAEGTTFQQVILGGYHRQMVEGLPSDVEVLPLYYDEGRGTRDFLETGSFIDTPRFYQAAARLCALTGLHVSSFHGAVKPSFLHPFIIDSVQLDARLHCDYPRAVHPAFLPNLRFQLAFHQPGSTVMLQNYTFCGPLNGQNLLPTSLVVRDRTGRYYYGAEQQQVWQLDSQTRFVQEIDLTGAPELSLARGAAWDSQRNRLVVVSIGGEGHLHTYSPPTRQWTLLGSAQNYDLGCLTYHAPNDSIYGVTTAYGGYAAPKLIRFDAGSGEFLQEIRLPALLLDIHDSGFKAELVSVDGYLILLLEATPSYSYRGPYEARMYLIDPGSGQIWLAYRATGPPVDADGDGVPDQCDVCPFTQAGAAVDINGCSADQRDSDLDGVVDSRDNCPETTAGAIVNASGCSLDQLCPCDGPWRNHAEYIRCVSQRAWEFFRQGLITGDQRRQFVHQAASSNCGK